MRGPTNENTRKLVVGLDKHGKKSKKKIWRTLSEKLHAPSRGRAEVNIFSISKLAKKMKGKIFVIPGKLLSKGNIDGKVVVACLSCSEKARKKIEHANGKVISIEELMKTNPDSNTMVIVR